MTRTRWSKLRRWVPRTHLDSRSGAPLPRPFGMWVEALESRCLPAAYAVLDPIAFSVTEDRATWGQPVHVRYGLTAAAMGPFTTIDGGAAGAFTAQVVLSQDDVIDATDLVLEEMSFDRLAPGQRHYGTTVLTIPGTADAPPAGFPAGGPVWLGWRLLPGEAGTGVSDTASLHHTEGVIEDRLGMTQVGNEIGPNDSPDTAMPIQANATIAGRITGRADIDYYSFTLEEPHRVTVRVTPEAASQPAPTLALFGPANNFIVQSTGSLADGGGNKIVQTLPAGTFVLRVSAPNGAASSLSAGYTLSTDAAPHAALVSTLLPLADDVNGDGHPDLITTSGLFEPNVRSKVSLGNGDGTFQAPLPGGEFYFQKLADVNADGVPDVIAKGMVLLGNGDGTFQAPLPNAAEFIRRVTDLTGDGVPDLIFDNLAIYDYENTRNAAALIGNGDGTFQPPSPLGEFEFLDVADLDGDGKTDLVGNSGRFLTARGAVLLGNGDGTFQPAQPTAGLAVGAVADANGDGRPDLFVHDSTTFVGSLLLGNGDGTFQAARPTGGAAVWKVVDLNGDRKSDLFCYSSIPSDRSSFGLVPEANQVLLGNGDGTFRPLAPIDFRDSPVFSDVNGDGRTDMVGQGVFDSAGIIVQLGRGDGTFDPVRNVPSVSLSMLSDVNGDGRPDIVGTGRSGNENLPMRTLLGNGDGTFQTPEASKLFTGFLRDVNGDGRLDRIEDSSVALGAGDGTFRRVFNTASIFFSGAVDINQDGRLDLLGIDVYAFELGLMLLLGNGDGTFQGPRPIGLADELAQIVDVNGDGNPDIVGDGIQLGNGDGTFQEPLSRVGGPVIATANLNGDDRIDILSGRLDSSNEVFLELGNGDGTFQPPQSITNIQYLINSGTPMVADLNGDGHVDLFGNEVPTGSDGQTAPDDGRCVMLLGNGDGTFQSAQPFYDKAASSYRVVDLDGDGDLDVISNGLRDPETYYQTSPSELILSNGDGTFQSPRPIGEFSVSATSDVNGDGNIDLLGNDATFANSVLLFGNGDGTFIPSHGEDPVGVRSTPVLADFDGDGRSDVALLDDKRNIVFRRAIAAGELSFAAPVILNAGQPARDLIALRVAGGWALAAADSRGDSISLYSAGPDGNFERSSAFDAGRLPVRLAAADLNGDGRDDLVAAADLGQSLTIVFQRPDGGFTPGPVLPIGRLPSEIVLADLDGRDGLDIAVAEQRTGQVRVYFNDLQHAFGASGRYRTGIGPYVFDDSTDNSEVLSNEQTVALVAGRFDSATHALVAVNRGSNRINTLGVSADGIAGPRSSLSMATSIGNDVNDVPGQTVAVDFDRDGRSDLAVLMQDTAEVWVYHANGDGTFALRSRSAAGLDPTGLSTADVNGDGADDLIIGNGFGDVLFVLGNGDGSFRSFVRTDQRVPFVATDLNGDGMLDVVLADQARDHADALVRTPGSRSFSPGAFQRQGGDLIGPGAVAVDDFDGKNGTDLIFANSGSNTVLVYLRKPDGSFEDTPRSFFAGTNPVGLTVAQLNDDNKDGGVDGRDLPDLLVAAQGSNDVSVLFGTVASDGQWSFRHGPRLETGGNGPNSVVLRDQNSDGIADLFVTNGQSGTLAVLPGIGNQGIGTGFFRDANPQLFSLINGPITQTVIPAGSSQGFFVSSGKLFDFNAATFGVNEVGLERAVRTVTAVDVGEDTFLATANADGGLSILGSRDGIHFSEIGLFSDVTDSTSALQVLRAGNGYEVYVTRTVDNQPVVLSFGLEGLLPSAPSTPEPIPGGTTTIADKPLALVTTLLTLGDDSNLSSAEAADGEGGLGSFAGGTQVTIAGGVVIGIGERLLSAGGSASDEQIEPPPPDNATELDRLISGVREALRELGLVPPQHPPQPAGDVHDEVGEGTTPVQELSTLAPGNGKVQQNPKTEVITRLIAAPSPVFVVELHVTNSPAAYNGSALRVPNEFEYPYDASVNFPNNSSAESDHKDCQQIPSVFWCWYCFALLLVCPSRRARSQHGSLNTFSSVPERSRGRSGWGT